MTAVLTIAVLTIANVVCRSLLGFSVAFTEEVSQFCVIVVCFVGLSYAASLGRHIRMTAIYDQLSRRWRKRFMIGITLSTSCIMFVLAWYAVQYVWAVYQLASVYPVLRVPTWPVYAIAPIGLFLAGVQYAMAAYQNCVSGEIYISFHRQDQYEHPEVQEI